MTEQLCTRFYEQNFEQIYSEICAGYSQVGELKIRHLSFVEESRLKIHYNEGLERAKNLGLKPEKEELIRVVKSGEWSQAKELQIKTLRGNIETLERKKKDIKNFDQIDAIYDSIESDRKKIREISQDRYKLLNNTAENYAEGYLRNYTIAASVLINEKKVTVDDLDEMSIREFSILESSFLSKIYEMNYESIKKICIQPFFYTVFNLSDKSFDFFLRPLCELTIQQVTLLRVGETFAKIANEVPDLFPEYEGNPDKMLMFWYAVKNGAWEKHEEIKKQGDKFRALLKQVPPS